MTMTKEEILDAELDKAMDNNPFKLNPDGELYKGIISAMEIYATQNQPQEMFVLLGTPGVGKSHLVNPENITAVVDGIPEIEIPELTDRQMQHNTAAEKVRNYIDYSKHGAIVESLFCFIGEMSGVTYSELNAFYYNIEFANYDTFKDRGGSLTKHMASMRSDKKRIYCGHRKYIFKENGKWHTQSIIS